MKSTFRIHFLLLTLVYIAGFTFIEFFIRDPVRYYNLGVFMSLSGIYASWYVGGKKTLVYVTFFNLL